MSTIQSHAPRCLSLLSSSSSLQGVLSKLLLLKLIQWFYLPYILDSHDLKYKYHCYKLENRNDVNWKCMNQEILMHGTRHFLSGLWTLLAHKNYVLTFRFSDFTKYCLFGMTKKSFKNTFSIWSEANFAILIRQNFTEGCWNSFQM